MNPLKRARSEARSQLTVGVNVGITSPPSSASTSSFGSNAKSTKHAGSRRATSCMLLLLNIVWLDSRVSAFGFFSTFAPPGNADHSSRQHLHLYGSDTRIETSEISIDFSSTLSSRSNNGHYVNITGSSAVNGHHQQTDPAHHQYSSHDVPKSTGCLPQQLQLLDDEDIARPTANGGFTHTTASRAKISAANRGKVPWNKGKERSPETKAKIAAGVQARNRQRFLNKLADLGLTEEEYELQQQQEEERKRQAAQARRTEKGGYKPTEETKQKISRILKEKYAKKEIKPRNATTFRRGFSHSEETRRKISDSLRRLWNDDDGYRATMTKKAQSGNGAASTRKRISETLKAKWQDPEYRASMMAKISNRRSRTGIVLDESHRKKISDAMKAKWQDDVYRKKTLESIAIRKETLAATRPPRPPRPPAPKKKRPVAAPKKQKVVMRKLEPLSKPRDLEAKKPAAKKSLILTNQPKEKPAVKPSPLNEGLAESADDDTTNESQTTPKRGRKKIDGDVSQLKEDRRDLFELLYGDGDSFTVNERTTLTFDDENLEEFDPYGLDNE